MMLTQSKYKPHRADSIIEGHPKSSSAVEIRGVKFCGKTWASLARGARIVRLDDPAMRNMVEMDPLLSLEGRPPRIVYVWQVAPAVQNAWRRRMDEAGDRRGRFVLTRSSAIRRGVTSHSGAQPFVRTPAGALACTKRGRAGSLRDSACRCVRRGASRSRWLCRPPQQQIEPYASLLEEQHLIEDLPGRDAPLRPQSHGRSAFVDPSLPASPLSTTPWRLLSDTRAFETLFKELCPYDVCVCIDHGVAVRAVRFLLLGCRQARSGHRRRAFRWTTGRVRGRAERREGPEAERNLIRLSDKIRTSPAPRNPDPSFLAVLVGQASFCRQMQSGVFVIPITELGSLRGARIQAPTWEQRKLGELYREGDEKNVALEFGQEKTISVASMRWNPHGNGAAEESLSGYKVLRFGDLAFEGNRTKGHPYGKLVINNIGSGIMSARFRTLAAKGKPCVHFWTYFLTADKVFRSIYVNCTKRGTLMTELVAEELLEASVPLPDDSEQSRIGALFQKLDSLITLHQREVDILKNVKQGLLDKMFV